LSGESNESNEASDAAIEHIEQLFDARRYAEVDEFCTSLLAESPTDFRLFYHRAQAKNLRGDTRGAIGDLTSAIAQNEREPALHYFRGLWSLEAEDYQAAERDLAAAVEKEESLGSSYYLQSAQLARAIALLKLGDFSRAELQCRVLPADQRTFILGRQWSVSEVLGFALGKRRP